MRANWRCRSFPDRGQHVLSDKTRGLKPCAVVKKGEAFSVAAGSFTYIRDDDLPLRVEAGQETPERRQVAAGLLTATTSNREEPPILTAVAFVNCWEGRGSKAHQFLQLAPEAGPAYRLAGLSELIVCSGSVAMLCRSPRIPA